MGKKGKLKRNNPESRLEPRALRKAEQHRKQNKEEVQVDEVIEETEPIVTRALCNQSVRTNLKGVNHGSEAILTKVNTVNSSPQETTPIVVSRDSIIPPIKIQATTDKSPCLQTKTQNFVIPRPPVIDEKRLKRFMKCKQQTAKRCNEEEGRVAENDFPPNNYYDVENAINEVSERNQDIKEKIDSKKIDLEKSLQKITRDEHYVHRGIKIQNIILDEVWKCSLPAIRNPNNKDMNKESKDLQMIPNDKYGETQTLIRRFLTMRNVGLSSCVDVEIKTNKVADEITKLMSSHRIRESLLDCISSGKNNLSLGNKVLRTSTKLLGKMFQQMRNHDERLFGHHHKCSTKQWNRKVSRYNDRLNRLQQTEEKLMLMQEEKTNRILSMEKEAYQLCLEKENSLKKLKELEKKFEESVKDSVIYKKAEQAKSDKKVMGRVLRRKTREYRENLFNLDNRIEIKDGVSDIVIEECNDFVEYVDLRKTNGSRNDKTRHAAKKFLQAQRKHMLQEEQYQNELRTKIKHYENEIVEEEKQMDEKLHQYKLHRKKLHQFNKQMENFKYRDCPVAILEYHDVNNINTNIRKSQSELLVVSAAS